MIEILYFKNGLTVAELKKLIVDWPETHEDGEPTEVWVSDRNGLANQVKSVWPLEKRTGIDGKETADFLLSPEE